MAIRLTCRLAPNDWHRRLGARTKAFTIGSALAVQFHPEVRARDFERWLICNTGQIAAMADHSVTSLRQQAQLHANTAAIVGQDWLAQWLDRT